MLSCAHRIGLNLRVGGAVKIKDIKKQNEQTINTEGNKQGWIQARSEL